MKKLLAILAGAAALTLCAGESRADGFFIGHRGGHHGTSWGVNFGWPSGCYSAPRYYAPPTYYAPAPVYYAPAPVYYAPAPVYYAPAYTYRAVPAW